MLTQKLIAFLDEEIKLVEAGVKLTYVTPVNDWNMCIMTAELTAWSDDKLAGLFPPNACLSEIREVSARSGYPLKIYYESVKDEPLNRSVEDLYDIQLHDTTIFRFNFLIDYRTSKQSAVVKKLAYLPRPSVKAYLDYKAKESLAEIAANRAALL